MTSLRPAIFLDRDGTLNELVFHAELDFWGPPFTPDEVRIFDYVGSSLARLTEANFPLFVVTNQPDHAKGKTSLENLAAVRTSFEEQLREQGVSLTDSYYCLCHPMVTTDGYGPPCPCYKPSAHMLLVLAQRHGIDLARSWMIGDRDGDMACGRAAGATTIRVGSPRGGEQEELIAGDFSVATLADATEIILARSAERS